MAEQNNLALKVQQAVYEIAKQDVERAKAGHYPTVDLVAIYSDQKGVGGTITGRPIDLTSKEIGVQVSFPIFQGFAAQSRVREALATQERVFQDLNNTRRNNVLQVSQQYLNVTNGIGPGESTEAGVGIKPEPSGFHQTWTGSGRQNRGGCIECAAIVLFGATRLGPGALQLSHVKIEAEG